MRQPSEWLMTGLARVLIRVFFRRVELDGGDRVPQSGPVVLVANHTNGLVDGLLLMAALDRYPRFLGKATLFRIPPLWPFLKLAGVIPVYRTIDAVAGDGNVSAFATSRDVLASGRMIAVFPEGISHDDLSLQPLKTGAARIALEGAYEGIDGIAVIAVGLTYDAKARFRSRALVRVAPPTDVAALVDSYRADTHGAVRALTQDLAAQLSSVSPTFSSWAEAEWCSRVADVVVRARGTSLPAETELVDRAETASRLAAAQRQPDGASLTELRAVFAAYEHELELLGLSDAQVAAGYTRSRLRLTVLWAAAKVVIALPLAAIGVVIHILPFLVVKQLAKRPANEGIKATVKLLGCFASFLLVYVALGILVGQAFGAWVGSIAAAAAPMCGYASVRLNEHVRRVGGLVAGYHAVRRSRDMIDATIEQRAAVTDAAWSVLVGL